MTKRYVEIPADRLGTMLDAIGDAVRQRGGDYAWNRSGREIVFDLYPPTILPVCVRVFTTLDGDVTARDCGKDAVRIIVGVLDERDDFKFRPLEKGTKILRTAPRGAPDRVQAWLDRLRDTLREAYRRARVVRPCPDCGRPMARREGKFGPFLGCSGFPQCRKIVNVA